MILRVRDILIEDGIMGTSYPLPFKCKITPRSKEAANVVYQARASLGL